jgi:hypothetical protein
MFLAVTTVSTWQVFSYQQPSYSVRSVSTSTNGFTLNGELISWLIK